MRGGARYSPIGREREPDNRTLGTRAPPFAWFRIARIGANRLCKN